MTGSLSQTRGRPEPGRELDALIAEKVMGWTIDPSRCRVCGWPMAADVASGCVPGNCSVRPAPKQRYDVPPRYSTDISTAFTVVEKMVALGHNVSVMCDSDGSIMCEMATPAWRGSEVESARTVPLAICLASLAALSPADDGGAR